MILILIERSGLHFRSASAVWLSSQLTNQSGRSVQLRAMSYQKRSVANISTGSLQDRTTGITQTDKLEDISMKNHFISDSAAVSEPSLKKFRAEIATTGQDSIDVIADSIPAIRKQFEIQCNKTPILQPDFGISWYEALMNEFGQDYFQTLNDFVWKERANSTVYPPPEKVFAWTHHFPIQQTKVVILGQDPYHGPGQAHGLSFSVPSGIPPPPSLINICKEIREDIPGLLPSHGSLTGWAEQGVLLLNACLTVRAGAANSHKDRGWEQFTDAVIMWLNENLEGVVFLLWGKYAQLKGSKIDERRHHVLTAGHPSPLSVRFFRGCKHFSRANEFLQRDGKVPIDWRRLG